MPSLPQKLFGVVAGSGAVTHRVCPEFLNTSGHTTAQDIADIEDAYAGMSAILVLIDRARKDIDQMLTLYF